MCFGRSTPSGQRALVPLRLRLMPIALEPHAAAEELDDLRALALARRSSGPSC